MNKKVALGFVLGLTLLPTPAWAAGSLKELRDANDIVTRALTAGDTAIYILVGLAVIFIIYNTVFYFIRPVGDSRKDSGLAILWGIVGLFLIISIWGLVNILVNTFSTDNSVPKERFPTVDFINNNQPVTPTNFGM